MLGKRVDLSVVNNAGLYAIFEIDTTQDVTGWLVAGYVYDPANPSTSLMTLTTALDTTTKQITVSKDGADINTLLDGEESADYRYCILVRPGINFGLRFFYGEFLISEGGPVWA